MGVRPPDNDELDDGPDAVDFGIAALDALLDDADVSYPATGDEVVAALDDPQVAYDPNGNTVALSTVVEATNRTEFDSELDLLDALHPEFEAHRRSRDGLIEKLRALFSGPG